MNPEPKEPTLTEIHELISSGAQEVARLAFDELRKQLDFAYRTRERIESKAQGLLAATGVSLSLTLAALKLGQESARLPGWLWAVAGILALLSAVVTAVLTARALLVGPDTYLPRLVNVFDKTALGSGDTWHRFMVVHLADLLTQQEAANGRRADRLKCGQWGYLGFLGILAVVGTLLAASTFCPVVLLDDVSPKAAAPTAQTAFTTDAPAVSAPAAAPH